MKPDITLVARVTERCNLDCDYCYMDQKQKKNMSIETASTLVKALIEYNEEHAHFTWVGGEPLIQKDEFFKEIKEAENKYNMKGIRVTHSIQTNGIGLTPKRRKTLTDLGFRIGVSYDGSLELQNIQRKNRNGKQLGSKVMENLETANREVGTITVLTRNSLGKEAEIYFNIKRVASLGRLNFYAPTGKGLGKVDLLLPSKEEAKETLLRFYRLWRDDEETFKLNPFLDITRAFFTGISRTCEFSAYQCFRIVGSDTEGNIFTCSRSTHIPEAKLGNIQQQPLEEILMASPQMKILERYLKLKERGCKWFSLCSGGCPVEAYSYTGDMMSSTYYCCEVRGALFEQIERDLHNPKLKFKLANKVGLILAK